MDVKTTSCAYWVNVNANHDRVLLHAVYAQVDLSICIDLYVITVYTLITLMFIIDIGLQFDNG